MKERLLDTSIKLWHSSRSFFSCVLKVLEPQWQALVADRQEHAAFMASLLFGSPGEGHASGLVACS